MHLNSYIIAIPQLVLCVFLSWVYWFYTEPTFQSIDFNYDDNENFPVGRIGQAIASFMATGAVTSIAPLWAAVFGIRRAGWITPKLFVVTYVVLYLYYALFTSIDYIFLDDLLARLVPSYSNIPVFIAYPFLVYFVTRRINRDLKIPTLERRTTRSFLLFFATVVIYFWIMPRIWFFKGITDIQRALIRIFVHPFLIEGTIFVLRTYIRGTKWNTTTEISAQQLSTFRRATVQVLTPKFTGDPSTSAAPSISASALAASSLAASYGASPSATKTTLGGGEDDEFLGSMSKKSTKATKSGKGNDNDNNNRDNDNDDDDDSNEPLTRPVISPKIASQHPYIPSNLDVLRDPVEASDNDAASAASADPAIDPFPGHLSKIVTQIDENGQERFYIEVDTYDVSTTTSYLMVPMMLIASNYGRFLIAASASYTIALIVSLVVGLLEIALRLSAGKRDYLIYWLIRGKDKARKHFNNLEANQLRAQLIGLDNIIEVSAILTSCTMQYLFRLTNDGSQVSGSRFAANVFTQLAIEYVVAIFVIFLEQYYSRVKTLQAWQKRHRGNHRMYLVTMTVLMFIFFFYFCASMTYPNQGFVSFRNLDPEARGE